VEKHGDVQSGNRVREEVVAPQNDGKGGFSCKEDGRAEGENSDGAVKKVEDGDKVSEK
jgi:hypothetical protein